MNEAEARDVLLVRAVELAPPSRAWTEGDARAASAEAMGSDPQQRIVQRARLAARRLAERDATWRALRSAPPAALGPAVVIAAFSVGLFGDALAGTQRINLLAPPLLALLVWNLVVYAVLAWRAARPREPRGRDGSPARGGRDERERGGVLRSALARITQRWAARSTRSTETPAAAAFVADWARASAPLQSARIAAVLHLSAAALAAGALLSLYVRGLAFEYRAGWDSTFLSPHAVQALLGWVLGPASRLTGLPLPSADELAALRFSAGPGENAARWIHLHAVTLAAVVLLPRLALWVHASRVARRLGRDFPLSLDEPYFQRLERAGDGRAQPVAVLPYSYHLAAALEPALREVLARGEGHAVELDLRATVPLGSEDETPAWLPPPGVPAFALFALSATPERETHLAFAQRLAEVGAGGTRLALIDESGFRQRFGGLESASRVDQRRRAWREALAGIGHQPVFVDLAAPDPSMKPWR